MQTNKNLTVVMYHFVRDLKHSRFPRIKGITPTMFHEQVLYFKKHYNFVTAEQLIDAYYNDNTASLPAHPVLLTFDDAYIDQFTNVFPILMKEHVQGCFYAPVKSITEHSVLDPNKIHFILAATPDDKIPQLIDEIHLQLDAYKDEYNLSDFDYYYNKLAQANRLDTKEVIFIKRLLQVELEESLRKKIINCIFQKVLDTDEATFSRELYMNIDQMRCMVQCGMHVGSHGFDHYWLNSLNKEKQTFEIESSLKYLKECGVDMNNWTMCYPYGAYNQDTIDVLKGHNCKFGLTTRVDTVDMSKVQGDNIFKLPRFDTIDFPFVASAEVNDWYNK